MRSLSLALAGILLFLSAVDSGAADVALLYDVSRSMQREWYSQSVKNSIASIILGGGIDKSLWEITGASSDAGAIAQGTAALTAPGERIISIRFGDFEDRAVFPYFRTSTIEFADREQARRLLMQSMPSASSDQWTNKELARAVASKLLRDAGSSEWYLLMVSDFNQDYPKQLPDDMEALIDEYEVNPDCSKLSLLVLRLRSNHSLQMKLTRVTFHGAPPRTEPQEVSLECGLPKKTSKIMARKAITFNWIYKGPQAMRPVSYSVTIVRTGEKTVPVLARSEAGNSYRLAEGLRDGRYKWWVSAFIGGRPITSQRTEFQVRPGFPWLLIIIAALVAGVLVFSWVWQRTRRKRKEE